MTLSGLAQEELEGKCAAKKKSSWSSFGTILNRETTLPNTELRVLQYPAKNRR